MPVWSIVLLIVIVVLIAALVALTIVGRKLQKKQEVRAWFGSLLNKNS